jgi:hypothetical protein
MRENSLVPLVKRVPEARLFELVDGLAGKLLGAGKSAKEPQHDMGAIGLKTVVGELAATDAAAAAIKRLAPKLTAYLSSPVLPHLSPASFTHPSSPPALTTLLRRVHWYEQGGRELGRDTQ